MKLVNCKEVFKDDPKVIYIGRPGPFGNPFRMREESIEERAFVIEEYAAWFKLKVMNDFEFRQSILALRGYDLACWCPPEPCHGDVIIEWLGKHKAKV